MTLNIQLKGEPVTLEFNENGLLTICSHWQWLLTLERAGIVAKTAPGGMGVPANYKLGRNIPVGAIIN